MFNVGGGEIFVILLVALIVLGPERLPSAVRQAGQFMGELRKLSSGFQRELKGAFDDAEKTPPQTKEVSAPMAVEPDPEEADGEDQPED